MRNFFLLLLFGALLMGSAARAQAPAAEVQALTVRLNELMHDPRQEPNTEVLASLANCGIKQTIRKYRTPEKHPTATNVALSSSKNGSSWGFKTNEKVELELILALDWAEVGSIAYAPQKEEKTGRRYYDLTMKRRERTNGKSAGGLTDTLTFALYSASEQEAAELVRRLSALSRQCQGHKS